MSAMRRTFPVLLILALAGLGPSFLNSQEEDKVREKTLARVDDPVVIEGKEFGPLLGQPLEKLSLLVIKSGRWSPAPFQLDEKKPDGEYAFTHGPKASLDPDPGLDANDELVFMVKDIGNQAEGQAWPRGAEGGVEIEVRDPNNGGKAWAYLFAFSGAAPRSEVDYVRYKVVTAKKRREVITQQYVMQTPLDRVAPDFIARVQPDGAVAPDILDQLKIRGKFVLPLGAEIDYIFDDWAKCKVGAYIDGPVRVLEYGLGYLDLATFVKIESQGYSVISYYDNCVIWPTYIEVPFDLRGIVKEWPTLGYMDFNENNYGTHAFSAANPYSEDVLFDGKMSEAEKDLNTTTEIDWVAGFGPQGGMVSRLPKPSEWKEVKILPYYLDDETMVDKPEDNPGVSGIGYKLLGFEKLGKYSATFYQYYYFKRDLKPENVQNILDIIDHPLTARIKIMEKSK